jgi:hypothetical protein
MPDHKRGFTQRDEGYQAPNPELASAYNDAAKFRPFEFDDDTQRFLIEVSMDVCARRGWKLYGASTEPTHLHDLVSWRDATRWEDVRGKIKNIMSLELSKRSGEVGRRWFVEEASRRRVERDAHFDYLKQTYLPDHGGWRYDDERGWTPPRTG